MLLALNCMAPSLPYPESGDAAAVADVIPVGTQDEIKDVSATEAGRTVVTAMDRLLNSVVDYQAVDLECKREDKKLYQKFIQQTRSVEELP